MPLSGAAAAVAAADDFLSSHLGSLLARQPSSASGSASGSGSQSGAAQRRRGSTSSSTAGAEPRRSGSTSSAAGAEPSGSCASPRTSSHSAASLATPPRSSHARSCSVNGDAGDVNSSGAAARRTSAPSAGFTTRFGCPADLRRGSRGGPRSSGSTASSSSNVSASPTAATSRHGSSAADCDAWGAPSLFGFSLGSSEPLIDDDAVPHALPEPMPTAPPGIGSQSVPSGAQASPRYTSMISSRRPSGRHASSSLHGFSRPASATSSRRSQAGSRASSPDAALSERAGGGLQAVRETAEELAARREADLLPPAPDCAEPVKGHHEACAQKQAHLAASELVLVPFGDDGRSFRFVERASLSAPSAAGSDSPAHSAAPAKPEAQPPRRPGMPHAACRKASAGSTGGTAFSLPSPGSASPFSSSPGSECPALSPSTSPSSVPGGRSSPDDSGPDTPEDGVALRPASKEELPVRRSSERDPLDRQAKRVVDESRHRHSPEIVV